MNCAPPLSRSLFVHLLEQTGVGLFSLRFDYASERSRSFMEARLERSEVPADQISLAEHTSYVREARDSGAARSPEPAAKPCGSCSEV